MSTAIDHAAIAVRDSARFAPLRMMRSDGNLLTLDGQRCVVMGIVNLTPDSFSDGGRLHCAKDALAHAERLVAEGAEILDVGAESTRPGARLLSVEEEWHRLFPVVRELPSLGLPAVLSIDTRHAEIARRVHELGFRLLNLAFPQHLFSVTLDDPQASALDRAQRHALLAGFDGIVVMHSRGTPATMRELTEYGGDLCQTVEAELSLAARMLTDDSVSISDRILYDPGLGFAKTVEQSLALLRMTDRLRHRLQRPLLVGASRKSMWGALTGKPAQDRLIPSVMGAAFAACNGADIVRVHDVAETKQALLVADALRSGGLGR